jgi:hypothetical protein
MEQMNTDRIYAEQLAGEYAPKDAWKVAALRKLDQRAKLPATILAYSLGIVAALVLGAGMCLTMGVIGDGTGTSFGLGIVIGIAGIIGVCANCPLYLRLLARGKERYAADIVRLAQEIGEGQKQPSGRSGKEPRYGCIAGQMPCHGSAHGRGLPVPSGGEGVSLHHREGDLRLGGRQPLDVLSAL